MSYDIPEDHVCGPACHEHVHVAVGGWDGIVQRHDHSVDPAIPPAGTEVCDGVLNIAGKAYGCELQPPHRGWGHQNGEAQALWR